MTINDDVRIIGMATSHRIGSHSGMRVTFVCGKASYTDRISYATSRHERCKTCAYILEQQRQATLNAEQSRSAVSANGATSQNLVTAALQ
jgi:hypothetical protein